MRKIFIVDTETTSLNPDTREAWDIAWQVYNPDTDTWKLLPSVYSKIIDGPESAYYNGKISLTDGYSAQSSDPSVGYEGTVKFI